MVPFENKDGSVYVEDWTGSFGVEYRDASHRYWLIGADGKRQGNLQSVTGILNMLDKTALLVWAEKIGVRETLAAVNAGMSTDLTGEQAYDLLRSWGQTAAAERDAGAQRGTETHTALVDYFERGIMPDPTMYVPEVEPYIVAARSWLTDRMPEPLAVEQVVGVRDYGDYEVSFAGRFDLLAKIDGVTTLVDFKTSAGVYLEHHLQLAAYKFAYEQFTGPEADWPQRTMIVSLGDDGFYGETIGQGDEFPFLRLAQAHAEISPLRKQLDKDRREAAKTLEQEVTN